jgi:hypothetical protein
LALQAHTPNVGPYRSTYLVGNGPKDKTIQKILKMPNTMYFHKDFHGGGKITSLISQDCYRNMELIGIIQLSVIQVLTEQKRPLDTHNQVSANLPSLSAKQKATKEGRQTRYGLLPPKLAEATPWDKLCVNLISPYAIRRKRNTGFTMIDPATGWFEIQQ